MRGGGTPEGEEDGGWGGGEMLEGRGACGAAAQGAHPSEASLPCGGSDLLKA